MSHRCSFVTLRWFPFVRFSQRWETPDTADTSEATGTSDGVSLDLKQQQQSQEPVFKNCSCLMFSMPFRFSAQLQRWEKDMTPWDTNHYCKRLLFRPLRVSGHICTLYPPQVQQHTDSRPCDEPDLCWALDWYRRRELLPTVPTAVASVSRRSDCK